MSKVPKLLIFLTLGFIRPKVNTMSEKESKDVYIMIFLLQTDEVHAKDYTRPGANTAGKQQTFMQ